jgi:bifunctional enzyme CysN/CysC/sulfate adenylyltransferase subunit 1
MATGASTADVAVVLIDAKAYLREGRLLPQSRRHTYIASLLGIPHVVAAVNKMDLVGYAEETFAAIRGEFVEFASRLGLKSVTVIAVSALEGDNVVAPSAAMPWYDGPTLLEFLETVPLATDGHAGPLRFPVQLVQRPDANFRGFAGQVARGVLQAGDRVVALPSRRETTVKRIVTWDGDLQAAAYPQSVTVELEDEIDLSRGEMLVAAGGESALPKASRHLHVMVVWMHEDPLVVGRTYVAKHTTRTVRATIKAIRYRVDVGSLEQGPADELAMNEIAEVELETNLPLFFDAYAESRTTGSMILIDGVTNATVGAAMIVGAAQKASEQCSRAALVLVPGRPELAERVREALENRLQRVVVIDDALIPDDALVPVVRALELAGVTAVTSRLLSVERLAEVVRAVEGFAESAVVVGEGLDDDDVLRLAGANE